MQKLKHIKLAGILMALSWLLLFFFVVQWLLARYGAEKEVLTKELGRLFSEARSEVIDSTLIINLIDPLLNNPRCTGLPVPCPDSNLHITLRLSGQNTTSPDFFCPVKQPEVYGIRAANSTPKQVFLNPKGKYCTDTGEIVLHSIRLIAGQASDTSNQFSVIRQMLPENIDTALFRKLFMKKLNKQGLNFPVIWFAGQENVSGLQNRNQITLNVKIFDSSIGAKIGRFAWYLIGKIIPQILFALILLVLSGIALVFTYRSLKKQVMLNNLRNDFIGNITHELKTPVATIKVVLESLRNFDMKSDPAVASDYLSMASLEIDRLDKLISQVLNISVLEESDFLLTLRTSDLKTLAERVIRSLGPRFEKDKAVISLDAPDLQYLCRMDELFIEGVLINLLDNSLKYAVEKPRILVKLDCDQSKVTLTVSDNGPGIPEQYIRKVFDKFFRVPAGDRHNVKGHGLGLTYAAQVMKQHKGSITAENNINEGCTFILNFPAE